MAAEFIAATIPAKTVRTSDTTLFQVAMVETGDPLQWVAIAELNSITDPWVTGRADILIPPVLPSGPQSGILTPTWPAPVAAPIAAGTAISAPAVGELDFSDPDNSQYTPLI